MQCLSAPGQASYPTRSLAPGNRESGVRGTVRFSSMAYTWTIAGGWVGVPR